MLALWSADGVRGAAIPAAGPSATRRTRTFERRVRLASAIRSGALSTPAEASEDAFVS